jgi:hypothetical protein
MSVMAETVKVRVLAERGRTAEALELEPLLLDRARELRDPQDLGPALAAGAALRIALGDVDGAAALIDELEHVTRGRDPSQRVHELPQAARVCLAAGTIRVAEALVPAHGAPTYTRARLCLTAAKATIAEAHGDVAEAAGLHATAADGWRAFGNPFEEAQSRVGHARCLVALGRAGEAGPDRREAERIARDLLAVVLLREAGRS